MLQHPHACVSVITPDGVRGRGRELPSRFGLGSCYEGSVFGPKKGRRHLKLVVCGRGRLKMGYPEEGI